MIEVVQGDARRIPLADGVVQCVVTSPPYWGLRDYGVDGQIGLERTPEEYVAHLVEVFREVWRVLRGDGVVFLNLGDCYATNPGNGRGGEAVDGGIPHRSGSDKTHSGLKQKDLVGIPWMAAFALRADGWYLRSEIIWHKPNPMPESVTDRPTKAHEQVFLLSKSGTAQFWTHEYGERNGTRAKPEPDYEWRHRVTAERTRVEPAGNWLDEVTIAADDDDGRIEFDWSEEWTRRNLWRGHDYFYDADAVRQPLADSVTSDSRLYDPDYAISRPQRGFPCDRPSRGSGLLKPNPAGRNMRSVWTIATQSYSGAHFAAFPEKLVEPCILAGTSARGACPKCGAGWARVVERTVLPPADRVNNNAFKHDEMTTHGEGKSALRNIVVRDAPQRASVKNTLDRRQAFAGSAWQKWNNDNPKETVVWQPGCDCDAGEPVPQLVLDPFAGTGTVGRVCARYGRNFIGIELKREYIGLAQDRTSGVQITMDGSL